MKKLYILGLSLMTVGAIDAQTYLTKDFEDQNVNSGGFTSQVVVGTADWVSQLYNNNNFAKISNYDGTNNNVSECWYISPLVDLSVATSPVFSFRSSANFSGSQLEVFMSTDYDGTSAPSSATWTTLSAPLSTGNYTWVNSGEIALTGTNATTYFAFKYTGTSTDGKTWQIDDLFVGEAGSAPVPAAPVEKTITEIQSTLSGADSSYYHDTIVTTSGIVTAINTNNGSRLGYYIQDGLGAWTGIYVYDPSSTCSRGDSLTITGKVSERKGIATDDETQTQISDISSTVVVSSANDVPATLIATYPASYEEYESVLVRFVNANCTAGVDQYGNFRVDDGSGYGEVSDNLYAYSPSVGTSYNITGVVQYFLYFTVAPRDANDISVYTSITENNAVLSNVYPNPSVNGNVTIEVKENTSLVVLDLLGNVVVSNSLNTGLNSIDVSSLAAGNYILKVGSSVQQLMVK
jgi:hypothetical protein